jgi:hypothetical protein
MSIDGTNENRVSERLDINTEIDFYVDADVLSARSVNISGSGIRFDTDQPIKVCMRVDVDGALHELEASLVWARRNDAGGMAYGFEFPDGKGPKL